LIFIDHLDLTIGPAVSGNEIARFARDWRLAFTEELVEYFATVNGGWPKMLLTFEYDIRPGWDGDLITRLGHIGHDFYEGDEPTYRGLDYWMECNRLIIPPGLVPVAFTSGPSEIFADFRNQDAFSIVHHSFDYGDIETPFVPIANSLQEFLSMLIPTDLDGFSPPPELIGPPF